VDAAGMKGPVTLIDIGTNTFEYLIAKYDAQSYEIIDQGKIPVWLGKGGIVDGIIQEDALDRAEVALKDIAGRSKKLRSKKIIAVATSATRDASNSYHLNDFAEELGFELRVIEGDEEAALIQEGTSLGLPKDFPDHLIMDIGGGSTEFIQVQNGKVLWKRSFDIGVTRLLERIKPSDPLTPIDSDRIRLHIRAILAPLRQQITDNPVSILLGSAGSFDSLVEMLHASEKLNSKEGLVRIDLGLFGATDANLRSSSIKDRQQMEGLIPMRSTTMHLATFMIAEVVQMTKVSSIIRSPFALKEGMLKRVMQESS
jgi:exopolyphosphatase/guanosine-5'-triphosphate,3'-diphosphate pyrophosphatase